MGNSNSSSNSVSRSNSRSSSKSNVALALRRRSFRRSSISSDLEHFASPTGLYPTCPWDARAARRLVMEKKIGPRVPGRESKDLTFATECPICFLFYPDGSVNTTACCRKPMCSECYLQIHPPKQQISCPYCNHEKLSVKYAVPADLDLAALMAKTAVTSVPSPSSSLSSATPATPEPTVLANMASVEERAQLEENLRSQLHLSKQPIRSSSISSRGSTSGAGADAGFVTEPHYFFASSADAARLEELMLMEAIRRSMQEVTMASKPNEGAGAEGHAEGDEHEHEHDDMEYQYSVSDEDEDDVDDDDGDYDTLRPSQITLSNSTSGSRPSPSWNPFD